MEYLPDVLGIRNFEHKSFVPLNKLKEIFTYEKIYSLVKQHVDFHHINEVVNRVSDGGIRTFALLAAVQDIGSITSFIREDQYSDISLDAKLPLKDADIPRYFSNSTSGELFICWQWAFLAPIFSENRSYRELDDQIILPFLRKEQVGKGGFATVYKVKVHASHHGLSSAQTEVDLICKELDPSNNKATSAKEFEQEVNILSALRCLQHPNIITLITAFSKGSVHSFLFPVADGDLKILLDTSHHLPGFRSEIEIFGSLWGLFSALEAVHEYYFSDLNVRQIGCHYDIKPKNILFHNGRLLLSDFGISRLRREEDGSQTTFKRGEGCYLAPECESIADRFKPGRIGRASDVWSLGCVLAEILAYYSVEPVNGPVAVRNFYEERQLKVGRSILYLFHGDSGINPGVQRFLETCKANHNLSDGLRSLARVVEKILQFDQDERPFAKEITQLLFHLTQQIRVAAINLTFHSLGPLDLQLKIELERLKIWSDTVGLSADLLDVPKSTWFTRSHSIGEYHNLQQLLVRIETEISIISTELQRTSPNRPTFPLYYHLQQLQDQLWDSQSLDIRQHMSSRLEDMMLEMDVFISPQGTIELTQGSPIDTVDDNGDSLSTDQFRTRLSCQATMRSVASALVRCEPQIRELHLDRGSIKGPRSNLGVHEIATLESTGKRVLIEYMTYQESWHSHEDELVERINSIASLRGEGLLESNFPLLRCCGYFHEPWRSRFGIVYKLPQQARDTDPISFLSLLEDKEKRRMRPSLTHRYKLASALVAHIRGFHRVGWLHKGMASFNIIYFPDAFSSIPDSFAAPYFIGFNYSRVNKDSAFSSLSGPEMKYQHPAYRRNAEAYTDNRENGIQRFRQEFDYYSIGIVLMEIAFWKPLKLIIDSTGIMDSPEKILDELLKECVPLVQVRMGDIYEAVVKYCLTAYKDGQRSPEDIRKGFNENVVLPLSRCVV